MNYFLVEIKGKNTKDFLKRVFHAKINIDYIKYEKDRILLKLSYKEYENLIKLKTSCQVKILKTSGKKKIIEQITNYKLSLITFLLGIILIIILSKIIFFINIDTKNKDVKNLIINELKNNNLTIFSFHQSNENLKDIEEKIKNNNLDNIEWISLSKNGVTLNVKVIERIKTKSSENNKLSDIIADKNGYIKKISSPQGQILKNIGDYVKKGDIIISGNIFRNDKVAAKIKAKGKVYAEVWYKIKTNAPLSYNKISSSNKGYVKLEIRIEKHDITFFKIPITLESEKTKKLFHNNNFSLYLEKIQKKTIEKAIYSDLEISRILEVKARNALLKTLESDEYIIDQKTLKKYKKNDKMYIEFFFKTYEDIAKEKDIKKIEEKED